MNIEEEKKAFESVFKNADLSKTASGNYENNAVHWACVGWLAAKEHAKKMAKQTVKIMEKKDKYGSSYPFVLSLFEGETFNGVLEDFHTEDDAKEWAERNGYRVIK